MKIYKGILLASSLLLAHSAFADEDEAVSYWEVILMSGIANLDTQGTNFQMTPSRIDELEPGTADFGDAWTIQLGIGYAIPLFDAEEDVEEVQWFTAIEPQINAYYLEGDVNGNVDRYADIVGDFDDTQYTMDINSTRVMFDLALTIVSYDDFSLYAIGGIGPSWNDFDLTEHESDCVEEVRFDGDDVNLAYEFGGGITYAAMDELDISLQYLYTNFLDLEFDDNADIGDGSELSNIESDDFDFSSQALVLGLRYAF
jgi:opacity protein-like surface antigen